MAPTKKRRRGHDRGQVLVDLAVAIADGATAISDLRVLADQPALFGEVASVPTAWRTLEAVDACSTWTPHRRGARLRRVAEAWAAGLDPGFYVIDLDATLVGAHSEKEGAAPNYKHGFGFQPLMAFLDATGEPLAALLRPGNAAPGNADDHVIVLDDALAQLPIDPLRCEVIARTDSAGCSHKFTEACAARGVRFIVGHKLSAAIAGRADRDRGAQKSLAKKAISVDGAEERDSGEVAEITDLVDLSLWGEGTRMIARRELPHPGAQLTFSDVEGYRYQVFITDHGEDDACFLDALYRGRGRCERRICDAKDTGLTNLPSASFAINAAWLALVLIAGDLLVWMKGLCLEGRAAPVPSPSGCAMRSCTPPACWCARRGALPCASRKVGPGPTTSWRPSLGCRTGRAPERLPPPFLSQDTELIEHAHQSGTATAVALKRLDRSSHWQH